MSQQPWTYEILVDETVTELEKEQLEKFSGHWKRCKETGSIVLVSKDGSVRVTQCIDNCMFCVLNSTTGFHELSIVPQPAHLEFGTIVHFRWVVEKINYLIAVQKQNPTTNVFIRLRHKDLIVKKTLSLALGLTANVSADLQLFLQQNSLMLTDALDAKLEKVLIETIGPFAYRSGVLFDFRWKDQSIVMTVILSRPDHMRADQHDFLRFTVKEQLVVDVEKLKTPTKELTGGNTWTSIENLMQVLNAFL